MTPENKGPRWVPIVPNGYAARHLTWKSGASSRTGEEKGNGIKRDVRLENEMSPEYIRELYNKQNGRCYWSGIPLDMSIIERGERHNSLTPSLDRIHDEIPDPDNPGKMKPGGYTKDNVVITIRLINLGRQKAKPENFKRQMKILKEHFQGINNTSVGALNQFFVKGVEIDALQEQTTE